MKQNHSEPWRATTKTQTFCLNQETPVFLWGNLSIKLYHTQSVTPLTLNTTQRRSPVCVRMLPPYAPPGSNWSYINQGWTKGVVDCRTKQEQNSVSLQGRAAGRPSGRQFLSEWHTQDASSQTQHTDSVKTFTLKNTLQLHREHKEQKVLFLYTGAVQAGIASALLPVVKVG